MSDTQQPKTPPFPLRQTLPETEAWENIRRFQSPAKTNLTHRTTVTLSHEITEEIKQTHRKALEILRTTQKGSKREMILTAIIGQVHGTRIAMTPKRLRQLISVTNRERLHPEDISIYTRDNTLMVLGSTNKTIAFPTPKPLPTSPEENLALEKASTVNLLNQIAALKQLLETIIKENDQLKEAASDQNEHTTTEDQTPEPENPPLTPQSEKQILLKTLVEIISLTIRSPERQKFFLLIANNPEGVSTSFIQKTLGYDKEKLRIKMAQLNKDKLKRYNLKIVRQDNKLILVVLGEEDHQPLPTEPPKAPEPEVIRPTPKGPPVNTHQELKNRIETLARKHLTPGPADEIKKESVETLLSEIQKINVVGSITPDQLRNYESMIRTLLSRKEGTHFEFREVRQLYNFRF